MVAISIARLIRGIKATMISDVFLPAPDSIPISLVIRKIRISAGLYLNNCNVAIATSFGNAFTSVDLGKPWSPAVVGVVVAVLISASISLLILVLVSQMLVVAAVPLFVVLSFQMILRVMTLVFPSMVVPVSIAVLMAMFPGQILVVFS